MNTVTGLVQCNHVGLAPVTIRSFSTSDVNEAMRHVHDAWRLGHSVELIGPYGIRYLEPPIEDLISQLPDDSQARHDRNRARQKLP